MLIPKLNFLESTSLLLVFMLLVLMLLVPASGSAEPASEVTKTLQRPRMTVDTEFVASRGQSRKVHEGDDLQAALNGAEAGDTLILDAGASFVGTFTLPAKSGNEWIVVRSSASEVDHSAVSRSLPLHNAKDKPIALPSPGFRVDPSYSHLMPTIIVGGEVGIVAAPGAHHYRFIGIEIRAAETGEHFKDKTRPRQTKGAERERSVQPTHQTLVSLGSVKMTLEQLPHHIIFDRCFLRGNSSQGTLRGIAMNSRHTAVIDSYLADFKSVGFDSQAIAGWAGPGPFKIENNYLEGAGENVMFGGGTPGISGLVPSDIEIRRNYFYKPLSWKIGHPQYAGTPWTIKNLFELKNARRVVVEGNIFENSWLHAQDGFAVLLTVRTENDKVAWAAVEDVLFTNNVIRNSGAGINVLGVDDNSAHGNGHTWRIEIKNNLFTQIGGEEWGSGVLFQLLDQMHHISIDHNTALQSGSIAFGERAPLTGFVFSNNIVLHNDYGFIGSGSGVGNPSLERYFPNASLLGNVIAGGPADAYPKNNYFPESLNQAGFMNQAEGDFRLKESSPYKHAATDGTDIGVNFKTLCAALGSAWPAVVACTSGKTVSTEHILSKGDKP